MEGHRAGGRRKRGRPPLTRERFGLVFALARAWHGRVRVSPKAAFVQVLGIVLQEIDGECRGAYGIARRAFKGPMPGVGRTIEPTTLRDLTR